MVSSKEKLVIIISTWQESVKVTGHCLHCLSTLSVNWSVSTYTKDMNSTMFLPVRWRRSNVRRKNSIVKSGPWSWESRSCWRSWRRRAASWSTSSSGSTRERENRFVRVIPFEATLQPRGPTIFRDQYYKAIFDDFELPQNDGKILMHYLDTKWVCICTFATSRWKCPNP